jgi:hypothetical protein
LNWVLILFIFLIWQIGTQSGTQSGINRQMRVLGFSISQSGTGTTKSGTSKNEYLSHWWKNLKKVN